MLKFETAGEGGGDDFLEITVDFIAYFGTLIYKSDDFFELNSK